MLSGPVGLLPSLRWLKLMRQGARIVPPRIVLYRCKPAAGPSQGNWPAPGPVARHRS